MEFVSYYNVGDVIYQVERDGKKYNVVIANLAVYLDSLLDEGEGIGNSLPAGTILEAQSNKDKIT
jgi:hypothetical protein